MRRDEEEDEEEEDLNDTTRTNNTSQADAVETLEIERTRALTSLKHLVRSNEELEVELAREDGEAAGEDADGDKAAYASAIEENKRAIANVQERIYALSREISQITGVDVRLGGDDANARGVDGDKEGGAWV